MDVGLLTPPGTLSSNEQDTISNEDAKTNLPAGKSETETGTHGSTGTVSCRKQPPVTFVDPVGTRWALPYDACRTWAVSSLLRLKIIANNI